MIVGLKTGPKSWQQGREAILQYGIQVAEIWYRSDWPERYTEIFDFFHTHQLRCGLHYWGVVDNNILPSFCHDEMIQYRQGIESVKRTIDIAAQIGAYYLNIHPGSRVLTQLNNDFNQLNLLASQPTPVDRALELLIEAVNELDHYAAERNVLFLTETIPARDASNWEEEAGRLKPLETHHASMDMLIALAERGFYIANDFSHSAMSQPDSDRETMWQSLWQATQNLAPQTKLLHINTVSPPFNGTDSHDGILPTDWERNVFPNESQMKQLLGLFKDRDDVWAVPEPADGLMTENYLALRHYADVI